MTQQHMPAGSPEGGQFVALVTPETSIDLSSEGTFQYPPQFDSADELVAFYSSEQPPPEMISDFRSAAQEAWEQETTARQNAWLAENPEPNNAKKHEVWTERAKQAFADIQSSMPPRKMPDSAWGPLCRIQKMADVASDIGNDNERNKVWWTKVRCPLPGGRVEGQVAKFYQDFRMGDFSAEAYRDRKNSEASRLAQTLDEMRRDQIYRDDVAEDRRLNGG